MNSEDIWRDRAQVHIKAAQQAWIGLGWPMEIQNRTMFESFASYPGLALMCYHMDQHKSGSSNQLRQYLSSIPGVANAERLMDHKENDVRVANNMVQMLIPICIEIMTQKAPCHAE